VQCDSHRRLAALALDHRWLRSQFALLCRMSPKYKDAEPRWEEPNVEFQICVFEVGRRR
jgi:hypothetical protein